MNTDNYEQRYISEAQMGDKINFLKEGMIVNMQLMDETPIDIMIPTFVELQVVETSASIKTGTVTAQLKSARLETGATIDVPSFIKEGDVIKVDTRTGAYVERVTGKK
jgi:elongation factor P